MRHTNVFGMNFLRTSQKGQSFKIKNSPLQFPLHLFHKLKTTYTVGSRRNYDPLKQNCLNTPKLIHEDL